MQRKYYSFPAYFFYDPDGISIEFPDLPGCLPCAKTDEEAFLNASDALGLHLFGMEEDGDNIPAPTPVRSLNIQDNAAIAMVHVFMPSIRDRAQNRFVKKTLSIPAWLNREAEKEHVNFSQVLQQGLKEYLGV